MSTTPEQPQTHTASDPDFDELTGVYGFFRKHQKKLLYTAGLFTLLTFSITGPIIGLVRSLFNAPNQIASILVGDKRVELTADDYRYGRLLSQQFGRLPNGVMLSVSAGEGGGELGEVFAMMRRAAIAEGIEPSMVEVDRAIEMVREQINAESATQVASRRQFGSLAEYRQLVAEALRIGTHQRVQMLALDTSDAEVMRQVLLYQEKVGFDVAVWDEQARFDAMKAASELTDDELREWLDGRSQPQKTRMGAFDLPRVQLRIGALLLEDGQFDPSQWTDGVLKDFTVGEDRLKKLYELSKERFKVEGSEDEYRQLEDEDVQAELTRQVQAERVMSDLNTRLKQKQTESLEELVNAVTQATSDWESARLVLGNAKTEQQKQEKLLELKNKEIEAKPDDADLKAEAAQIETALAAAKEAVFAAEPAVEPLKAALDAAKDAEQAARIGFDVGAELMTMVEGKSGFVTRQTEGLVTAEDLEDLDALELGLGKWPRSSAAPQTREPGTIGNAPATTDKAVFVFQSMANDNEPLKPWDELKPLLQDAYWTDKAATEAREKQKDMQAALLRLAKEKIPEFVTEHEGKRQSSIDGKIEEWETAVRADIAHAEEMLERPGLGTKPKQAWQTTLDNKRRELESKEMRTRMFESQADREIENEIATEARKHYGEVLAAAAAEVGYEVSTIAPLPRSLAQRPRFDAVYGDSIAYVFQHHSELKQGETVGPVVDSENKRYYVISCTVVEPMTAADVTRREFEMMRRSFDFLQVRNCQSQGFTHEAMAERYGLEKERGNQVDVAKTD